MAFSHLFHFSGHFIIEETFGGQNRTLNYICKKKRNVHETANTIKNRFSSTEASEAVFFYIQLDKNGRNIQTGGSNNVVLFRAIPESPGDR